MEYFTIDDQSALIDLHGRKSKFVYRNLLPGFMKETGDKAIELLKELELRNFDVPGFEIGFYLDRDSCEIKPWKICCMDLNLLITGNTVTIKGKEVSIYDDGSGSLNVYALNDWESDKKEFMYGKKFNRRLDKQSRLHLGYSLYGNLFKTNGYDSREYAPEGNEPTEYRVASIEIEVFTFLSDIVEVVKQYEKPNETKFVFKEPEAIQLKSEWFKGKTLYAYRDTQWTDKNAETRIDPGYRLLSLTTKLPEHSLKNEMHEGFIYMEIDHKELKPKDTGILYNYHWDSKQIEMYEVTPSNYNQFFVIDASVFDELRKKWSDAHPDVHCMTDKLVEEYRIEEAKTMIHINEYNGQYKRPIVITNRILWKDELKKIKIEK